MNYKPYRLDEGAESDKDTIARLTRERDELLEVLQGMLNATAHLKGFHLLAGEARAVIAKVKGDL
jgi:hypothetical protein